MKLTRMVVVLVGLLYLNGVLAGTATATPVFACQVAHHNLRTDTFAAQSSFTNRKDWTDSLDHLDAVWPRLEGGYKDPVAVEELNDFRATMTALATQAKIDPAVAQRLATQAQDIIDCDNSLA